MSQTPLPCLKEFKWQGRQGALCHTLWPGKASQFMPWVAFGYDHPHTFEFINADRLGELNTTEEALTAQAIANLVQRPAKWQPMDLDLPGGSKLKMLISMEDFFSAERILDAAFMTDAQQQLNATGLFVGIPRRGVLMATSSGSSDAAANAFAILVAKQFSRGESALISAAVFAMKDGEIVGMMDTLADEMMPDGEPEAAKEPKEPDEDEEIDESDEGAPYVSAMTVQNKEGLLEFHIMGGGSDGVRLARGIEEAFQGLLKKYIANPESSGKFHIIVFGYTPVEQRGPIAPMVEHLRGVASELGGQRRPIEITLEYKEDSWGTSEPSKEPSQEPSREPSQEPSKEPAREPEKKTSSTKPDVYINPAGAVDRLIMLLDDGLIIANPDKDVVGKMKPGSPDLQMLISSGSATAISFASIKKVTTNKHGDTFTVTYQDQAREKQMLVCPKDSLTRDNIWDKLRRKLGKGFNYSDEQYGVFRAILAPLATMAFTALLTFLFYMAAQGLAAGEEAEIRGRNQLIKRVAVVVVGIIGPTGVLIVGGLIIAFAIWWLVRRISNPPRMLSLVRK